MTFLVEKMKTKCLFFAARTTLRKSDGSTDASSTGMCIAGTVMEE